MTGAPHPSRFLLLLPAAALLACGQGERPSRKGAAASDSSSQASAPGRPVPGSEAGGASPSAGRDSLLSRRDILKPDSAGDADLSDPYRSGWEDQPKDGYFALAEERDRSPDAGWSEDPADTGDSAALLTLGEKHGDEVRDDAAELSWLGLYPDSTGAHAVEKVRIRITPAFDVMGDKDSSAPSGKRVSATPDRDYILLVEGDDLIRPGRVPALALPAGELAPGRRMDFAFLGTGYRLAATSTARGYRLFLSAIRDGKETTQMILYAGALDDRTPRLVFAGDLDGDGSLDLILDDSGHYNQTAYSLYLSGAAAGGALVRRVGTHRTTGC